MHLTNLRTRLPSSFTTEPLFFEPFLRPALWGGRSLERFGKRLPPGVLIGESWEISGHPLHVSRVSGGSHDGALLNELWHRWQSAAAGPAGSKPALGKTHFPLLLKLLDCRIPLSVQVHPNQTEIDRDGRVLPAKTEAWIVLETSEAAVIYAGLQAGVDRTDIEAALDSGDWLDCLHAVTPRVGDCFLIHPGTVHTMSGVVLAEIQTSSDITLRLHDWQRVDDQGQPRELHIERGLAAIDWERGPVQPVTPRPLPASSSAVSIESLVDCSEFQVSRCLVHEPWSPETGGTCSLWMVGGGVFHLRSPGDQSRELRRGQTVLLPPQADVCWTPTTSGEGDPPLLLRFDLPGSIDAVPSSPGPSE